MKTKNGKNDIRIRIVLRKYLGIVEKYKKLRLYHGTSELRFIGIPVKSYNIKNTYLLSQHDNR